MQFVMSCPFCMKRYKLDSSFAGKKTKCKECDTVFDIIPPGWSPDKPQPRSAPPQPPQPPPRAGASPSEPLIAKVISPPPPRPTSHMMSILDDLPPSRASHTAAPEYDDDLPPPPRARIRASAPKKRRGDESPLLGNLIIASFIANGAIGLLIFLLAASGAVKPVAMTMITGMYIISIVLIAAVMAVGGAFWLIGVSFTESALCGLMCLFLPFYQLYYIISRWEDVKRPFKLYFSGIGNFALMFAFLVMAVMSGAKIGIDRPQGANAFNAPGVDPPGWGDGGGGGGGDGIGIGGGGGGGRLNGKPIYDLMVRRHGGQVVLLEVMGLPGNDDANRGPTNRDVCDAVGRRVKELEPGIQDSIMVGSKTSAMFAFWPVANPRALSQRIDFGTSAVEETTVRVHVSPNFVTSVPRLPSPQVASAGPSFAAKPPEPDIPEGADAVTKSLLELGSSDLQKRQQALERLARTGPNDRRDEVVAAILPLLDHDNQWLVTNALKALGRWWNEKAIEPIIARLKDDRFIVRDEACAALAKIKDPRGAVALADLLELQLSHNAEEALKKLGSLAEKPLLPKLKDPSKDVRRKACDILKEIGGQDTLRAMADLPADSDTGVQFAARLAWDEIVKRVGIPDDLKAKSKASSKKARKKG